MASPDHATGDMNFISPTRALVIERDSRQGDPALACPDGTAQEAQSDCFAEPARFKRIYVVDFSGVADGEAAKKIAFVDLLAIEDPDGKARIGGRDGKFAFPYLTVESVDLVAEDTIIVANDNNFPFTKGRRPGEIDANEFILLRVPGLSDL